MSGRVEDIDAVAAVLELEHRGCDRDTSLLFDLHPVGNGVARGALAFNGARKVYSSAVQQQLFRKGGFTRVRVRDYCEGSALCDFFL